MGKKFLVLVLALALTAGCSIKKMAINTIGNALAGGGATYASDDDPELIREAAPFSLKLMESLLAESPRHEGLLFATASGFTQYAYAFVQQEADEMEEVDLAKAFAMRARAQRLYLRARNYGLRGLEVRRKGFETSLRQNASAAVARTKRSDVPLMYWTAVSWAAAISLSKDNPDLIADLPVVEALIDRALLLDEDFNQGAIHAFLIAFEMSRQTKGGDAAARARQHFEHAVELSEGQLAGPFVSFAEAVSVQRQERAEFESLLKRALAIDPDVTPRSRLANLIAQRRARWLLSRADELFFEPGKQ